MRGMKNTVLLDGEVEHGCTYANVVLFALLLILTMSYVFTIRAPVAFVLKYERYLEGKNFNPL